MLQIGSVTNPKKNRQKIIRDARNFSNLSPRSRFRILIYLTDYKLALTCQVNTYASEICWDNSFWRVRAEERMSKLHLRPEFNSWREFYSDVMTSLYVVFIVAVYRDIEEAYRVMTTNSSFTNYQTQQQKPNIHLITLGMPIRIDDT